ncbi:MAG: nucleotidyltransferase domain-containing protein [Candidatus Caenarcaniphilales bacterium]|nr:nucleotidyltransferase domain-containing protein [Candidatus Caenarcaniphilales bacterium]
MEIDLQPAHRQYVEKILSEAGLLEYTFVFGSRAQGKAKKYSDLDLLIKSPEKIEYKALLNLKEEFEESNLPFKVDIVDWHGLTSAFKEEFMKTAIKLI